jgi:hypothetical protein
MSRKLPGSGRLSRDAHLGDRLHADDRVDGRQVVAHGGDAVHHEHVDGRVGLELLQRCGNKVTQGVCVS